MLKKSNGCASVPVHTIQLFDCPVILQRRSDDTGNKLLIIVGGRGRGCGGGIIATVVDPNLPI